MNSITTIGYPAILLNQPLADVPRMVYYIVGSHSQHQSAKYFSIGWSYPTFWQKYTPQTREE